MFQNVLFQLDFSDKLTPVPTSLFQDTGEPRLTSSKAVLQNKMKLEVSSRGISPDAVLVDRGGMLHSSIHWPRKGSVEDLVVGAEKYILKLMDMSDTYLVFDRYTDYSIKSEARLKRIGLSKRT